MLKDSELNNAKIRALCNPPVDQSKLVADQIAQGKRKVLSIGRSQFARAEVE